MGCGRRCLWTGRWRVITGGGRMGFGGASGRGGEGGLAGAAGPGEGEGGEECGGDAADDGEEVADAGVKGDAGVDEELRRGKADSAVGIAAGIGDEFDDVAVGVDEAGVAGVDGARD